MSPTSTNATSVSLAPQSSDEINDPLHELFGRPPDSAAETELDHNDLYAEDASEESAADDDLAESIGGWTVSDIPVTRRFALPTGVDGQTPRIKRSRPQPLVEPPPRSRNYLLFVLTLAPLIFFTLFTTNDVDERLKATLENNKPIVERLKESGLDFTLDDVLDRLPDRRIQGAHLSHRSWLHWLYALVSAATFFGLIYFLFDQGNSEFRHLLAVGLFTSTVGVVLLLMFQIAATYSSVLPMQGNGILIILILIIKFIGFSYHSALDSNAGFWLSFMGFTCGVGLCEEMTKCYPVLLKINGYRALNWRAACVWGLASGVGFGVAEGLMYSVDQYNGLQTGDVYLMRFVSCVGLHAIWAAAVGIMLYNKRELFDTEQISPLTVLPVIVVPMVLHGLYDTLLKMEYDWLAMLTALASFAWLIWLIERAASKEEKLYAEATSSLRAEPA